MFTAAKSPGRGKMVHNLGTAVPSTEWSKTVGLEGKIVVFGDMPAVTSSSPRGMRILRQGTGPVVCRIVRNVSGGTLLPRRLVRWGTNYIGRRVAGYAYEGPSATTIGIPAGVVDDMLPDTGVPDGELFLIIVKGPALIKTPNVAVAAGAFDALDPLVVYNTTSGDANAGRIAKIDTTGVTATLANNVMGMIGRAMSARTSGQTATDTLVLIDVDLTM